jgi:hypothetical protein
MLKGGSKNRILKNMLLCLLLCSLFIFLTIPIHEAAHWVMSEIDPYSKPVEYHIFDFESSNKKDNLLFLQFGFVIIKETYPGSFIDRPIWIDLVEELICFSIQILITYLIVIKILKSIFKNYSFYKNLW